MDFKEKIDFLEKENEASRRKIMGDERDARIDAHAEISRVAARLVALNEWRLVEESAANLDNLRHEEREEFPSEDASMDEASWLEAILGAWGAGGFSEAQKTAPPEIKKRKLIAASFARFAMESPLAAALAWRLAPDPESFGRYVAALLKNGRAIKADSLLWVDDSFADSSLRDKAKTEAALDYRRFREERLATGREEVRLWSLIAPKISGARLERIEFSVSALTLARWNACYLAELKRGRLFPLWLEMAPSRILSSLEGPTSR
ncbi:MAG: hypothetical protein HDQ93_03495 [Desulfovibrio sp.]|nr:hypothetical protein [Desulfovibrio sp.]